MRWNRFIPPGLSTCLLMALGISLFGQDQAQLSLSEAFSLLQDRYPLLQNAQVLRQIQEKELSQLDISRRPGLYWYSDGRFQSEVPSLDTEGAPTPFEIDLPLVSIKSYVEANYLILDGGLLEAQRKLKEVELQADLQGLEVEKYHLQQRIIQLFVGISLIREQSKLLNISLEDLKARREPLTAGVEFGTVLESELTKLEAKELELEARQQNLIFKLSGLVQSLGELIGKPLSENIALQYPSLGVPMNIPALKRPEQKLFQLQRSAILARSDLIETERQPKLSAFAQAGVGYPNPLNFLDNNVAPFGLIGARFSWRITDWNKNQLDRELLSLRALQVQNSEASFAFNLDSKQKTYLEEVKRLMAQIQYDQKLASLQKQLLQQLAVQLDEGVITTTDYILQLNTELAARQNTVIHELELLKLQLEFWNERGAL